MTALFLVWCELCFQFLLRVALLAVSGCVVIVVILFALMRYSRNRTYHHLKKFPGRFETIPLWRTLRNYSLFSRLAKETGRPFGLHIFHAMNGAVAMRQQQKHGASVDYVAGMPNLFIFKASILEEMLTQRSNISKGFGYRFLEPWLGSGLLLSTGTRWQSQRKMLVPAFHFRILDEFARTMNAQARIFMEKVIEKPAEDDVVPYISALALDITCETIMGTSLNAQNSDSGLRYLKGVHRLGELFMRRGNNPLHWFEVIYRHSDAHREFMAISTETHAFTRKVIEERKAELLANPELLLDDQSVETGAFAKSKKPFLDLMLQKHLKGEISVEDMRSQVDTLMFAGHDTTSMALTYVLYLTGYHPEVQRKLHEEVDAVFRDQDPDCDITSDHIREMKYMDMVFKEAQRLLPSVPLMGRLLDEDMMLDG